MNQERKERQLTVYEYPEWIVECMQHCGDRNSLIAKIADTLNCSVEDVERAAPDTLRLSNFFHEVAGPSIFPEDVVRKLAKYWFLCNVADRLNKKDVGDDGDLMAAVYLPSVHITISEMFDLSLKTSRGRRNTAHSAAQQND